MSSPAAGTGSVTIDASALIALLIDRAEAGRWVIDQCAGSRLVAPTLLPFEVANVLRRQVRSGLISADRGGIAHRAAGALRIQLWPYGIVAERVWALRDSLTSYDAAYCAVAELTQTPLLTLDQKLAGATGPHCEFRVFRPHESTERG